MTQPPPIVPGYQPPEEPATPEYAPAPPPPPAPVAPTSAPAYPPPAYAPYAYDPNQHIQVITKPGGLSGAAHAVHILICIFTCGIWLPGYLLFLFAAPRQRFEVIAPYGADPNLVARAQLEAEGRARARTVPNPMPAPGAPAGEPIDNRKVWAWVVGSLVTVAGVVYLAAWLVDLASS